MKRMEDGQEEGIGQRRRRTGRYTGKEGGRAGGMQYRRIAEQEGWQERREA